LVIHSDICCDLSCEEFYNFHKKYETLYCRKQAICSVMTVRVSKEESTKYGCLIKDTETD
jgi:mannose-1-phosphate guanylyltransferase